MSRRRNRGQFSDVVYTRGALVMDKDASTLPIFIACLTFTLVIALANVWV